MSPVNLAKVDREKLRKELEDNWINIRYFEEKNIVGISVDETSSMEGLAVMIGVFAKLAGKELPEVSEIKGISIPESLLRKQSPLRHEIFEKYHSETEMMRYMKALERRDISLAHSMISLGSCTMKLNAAAEMLPLSWSEFGAIHPFAPAWQAEG